MDPIKLRRNIGYVIQQIGLFPHMTIAANIALPLKLQKWPREKIDRRIDELLDLSGLDSSYRDRYPRELSGGQQQRIGVLRALAPEPDIILMDEPFGALDPLTREQLQDELRVLQEKVQKTIVFVTHDMDEALSLGDRIVLMKDGRIVQTGTPEDILAAPADDFVRSFIGKDRLLRNPHDVLVSDVMLPNPATIRRGRGVGEALERMRRRRVDTLLVVDGDRCLVGVVTADAAREATTANGRNKTIESLVTPDHPTVHADATVAEAAAAMAHHRASLIPVIENSGRLAGLLTRAGFVDIVARDLWNAVGEEVVS